MCYVYILTSEIDPQKTYVGLTTNLDERLKQHNQGDSQYTRANRTWKLETYIAFSNKKLAEDFERYLKVGSGHAFLKKRLLPKIKMQPA